jgi:hypothetical protein
MTRTKLRILYQQGPDGQPFSASCIRLFIPFSQPACRAAFVVSYGTDLDDGDDADAVIVERWWRSGVDFAEVERLVERVHARGLPLIYTMDDNLLDLEASYPDRRFLTADEERAIRYLVEAADGVVVSTRALAERVQPLNAKTHVVRNGVDRRLFTSVDRVHGHANP